MKMTRKNFKKARKLIATEHLKKVNQHIVYEYFATSELDKSKKYSLGQDLAFVIIYQRTLHYLVPELNQRIYDYCLQELDKVRPQPSIVEYSQFISKN